MRSLVLMRGAPGVGYNFWKFMRSLSHEVIRKGHAQNTSALLTPLANYYYGWIKEFVNDVPKEERGDIP